MALSGVGENPSPAGEDSGRIEGLSYFTTVSKRVTVNL